MSRRPKGGRLLDRSLMHTAARLHYTEGLSQIEVARRMEVSTATVSRLLSHSRKEGIVRIEVIDLDEIDTIGEMLREQLHLRDVRVVESGMAAGVAAQVGALLKSAELPPGSILAIGWGRTIQGVISAGLPAIPGALVVPTTGGMHQTAGHFQINEFVRAAAEQVQGQACFLYAPSLASSELRSVLTEDPSTAQVLDYWTRADAAVVGIGDFQRAESWRDVGFDPQDAERAAGDVLRHYFDEQGQQIAWPGQSNLIAIDHQQLRRIPLCIGVAIGREKAPAILGAVRSRMINTLVTDAQAAQAILRRIGEQSAG